MGQELMRALLLIEVFDHRTVPAGEILETFFTAGIGNSTRVKNKSATIACLIAWRSALMKGEAENPDSEIRPLRSRGLWLFYRSSKALQLRRIQHRGKRAEQRRQPDWQLHIIQQPLEILERIGNALQEMRLAFIKSTKTVCAQRLHQANINERIVMMHEIRGRNVHEFAQAVQVVVQQPLAQRGRQIRLSIIEKRRNVILQRALAAALIIEEKRPALRQHDVARLEVTIKEIVARRRQQKASQPPEVDFQRLLIERNPAQPQKVIFEVVEVPGNRLAVKAGAGIANFVIEIAACLHLKTRQQCNHTAIGLDDGRGNVIALPIPREELKQSGVAQILFQIGSMIKVRSIDLWNRQLVTAEVPRKFEKSNVFFMHVIVDPDGARFFSRETENAPSRTTQLSLHRLYVLHRRPEMLREKLPEDVHGECAIQLLSRD